jgi:uncharacterized secreted protein with C-terminal beta-propeller domain
MQAERTGERGRVLSGSVGVAVVLLALGTMWTACVPLESLLGASKFGNGQPELVAFGTCGEVEQFIKAYAVHKASYQQGAFKTGGLYDSYGFVNSLSGTSGGTSGGGGAGSPPEAQAAPFDQTNLQEAGVDEADIFKVDSTHAFALHGMDLVIIDALTAISNGGEGKVIQGGTVSSTLTLDAQPIEMFLHGDRVVVIARSTYSAVEGEVERAGEAGPSRPPGMEMLTAIIVDVTDRSKPVVLRKVAVEGTYIASRRIDDQLYLVARSSLTPPSAGTSGITGELGWLLGQQSAINGTSLDAWLPYHYDLSFSSDGSANGASVNRADCASTYGSYATGGDQSLSVYSLDVANDKSAIKTATIMADGGIVYASEQSIVVALTNYGEVTDQDNGGGTGLGVGGGTGSGAGTGTTIGGGLFDGIDFGFNSGSSSTSSAAATTVDEKEKTFLHRFELGAAGDVSYQATGVVDGWILNQFSISEYKGYLRVATTYPEDEVSMVYVLQPRAKSAGEFQMLANNSTGPKDKLSVVGSVLDIARDEKLYATRFLGDRGYLVTFRLTDPLWVIDLSTPTSPKIRGELVVPGYSTYLHPIEGEKLLAVGYDTWSDGTPTGIKLSLFDVSDDDNPTAIDELVEGSNASDSEAISEHRAFRYLDDEQMLMIPIESIFDRGLFVYDVDMSSGFSPRGVISHKVMADQLDSDAATVRRAYRIGDYVYSYSAAGVAITTLSDLKDVAYIDLPDLR